MKAQILSYIIAKGSKSAYLAESSASQKIAQILWNRQLITVFTRACHWYLSGARSVQFMSYHLFL